METIIVLAVIIIPVWVVLWVVGRAVAGATGRRTKAETHGSRIANAQMARTNELQNLAWKIKATSENERVNVAQYLTLEATDQELTRGERRASVDMQTVIDDQTQYELDNSINPWDVPAEPRAKSKRARLGWEGD